MLQDRRTPVLVDHDPDRVIGHIIDLHIWPLPEGAFHIARCEIDEPPEWLTTTTKVSVGCAPLTVTWHGGCQRILTALLDEVSVLPPGVQPLEPLARVAVLSEDPAKTREPGTVVTSDRPAVNYGHPGGLLKRPAIGEVLRVN